MFAIVLLCLTFIIRVSDVWVKEEQAEGLLIAGKSQGINIILTLTGGGNLLLFDYLWFCYTGEMNKPDLQQAIKGYSHLPIEWCQDGRVLVKKLPSDDASFLAGST